MALLSAVAIVTTLAVPAAAYPRPGRTHIASLATDGSQADHPSTKPVLDATGRFVAFESSAGLLPHGDYEVWPRDVSAEVAGTVSTSRVAGIDLRQDKVDMINNGRFHLLESKTSV